MEGRLESARHAFFAYAPRGWTHHCTITQMGDVDARAREVVAGERRFRLKRAPDAPTGMLVFNVEEM